MQSVPQLSCLACQIHFSLEAQPAQLYSLCSPLWRHCSDKARKCVLMPRLQACIIQRG